MLPEQTSAGRASGGDWTLEANLNRKANGLALEGPSVGLYVPLLEFNHDDLFICGLFNLGIKLLTATNGDPFGIKHELHRPRSCHNR